MTPEAKIYQVRGTTTAPTWAEISHAALKCNIDGIRGRVGPDREIWCAVKANAYGHGAVIVSQWLREMGVEGLCVARAHEGQELRDAGIEGPIALLTPFLPMQAEEVVAANLEPVVVRHDQIEALAPLAPSRPIPIHLKFDTGMGRVGTLPGDALEFARWAAKQPHVKIKGVCSHFPVADEAEKSFSRNQIDRFMGLVRELRAAGIDFEHEHIANSAAILDLPKSWGSLVRPGIMIYGLAPSPHVSDSVALEPVMTLKTRVIQVKHVRAGTGISYGLTWTAPDAAWVASLPIGYADGLPRLASNRAEMIVRGRRVSQIGRICMDMTMLNVTSLDGVEVEDEVVVWGRQGSAQIHVDEWAAWCETINYEMTTRVGPRVPRIPA
ncbi:alanine racemase [Candidatus Sumerlaeota bacterium]|nr:alanine racemase [Candidatus Sumerlaeota bacterium]